MQNYYLGLGSNIEPYTNVPRMLEALQRLSPELAVSSIISTQPKGIVTQKRFLNLAARIKSDLSPEALKAQFNTIERLLGRDRSDPNRSFKDRTADIDILFHTPISQQFIPLQELPPEPYLSRPMIELLHFLSIQCDAPKPIFPQTESVLLHGRSVGNGPMELQQVEV